MEKTIRLTSCSDGINCRERVDDKAKQCPAEQDDIGREAKTSKPEGPMLDVVTATDEETDHGDGVRDVEQDNARGDHAVECRGRSKVQQTQESDNKAAR